MAKRLFALVSVLILAGSSYAVDKTFYAIDFEDPDHARVLAGQKAEVVEPGFESPYGAKIDTKGIYALMRFDPNVRVGKNRHVRFCYKVAVRSGKSGYVNCEIHTQEGHTGLARFDSGPEWQCVDFALTGLKPTDPKKAGLTLKPNDRINEIRIYSRGADKSADHTLYLDNIEVVDATPQERGTKK